VGAAGGAAGTGDASSQGVENVVIVGSGPAGLTAAIYSGRANLKPWVFEGFQKGGVPGGQLMTTTEVENFPGFPEGITGPDLMDRMRKQAERWGAELVMEDVEEVDLGVRPFVVRSAEREVRAHSIIVAMGATARRLGLPREHEFWSRGISACAICDGGSPLFKGKELAVVGGGDTAVEEACYLTKYASHVHLLVRKDQMRASKAMQDRVLGHAQVTVHFCTEPVDVVADAKGQMSGVAVRDTRSGEEREVAVRGLFYGIGHTPNSGLFRGQLDMDDAGYISVKEGGTQTSVEGVFSAGDIHDIEWRQAITAAGSGCMAAISAERYLAASGLLQEFHQEDPSLDATHEAAKKAAAAEAADAASQPAAENADTFDPTQVRHRGQFALRKLYHESDRLIAVLYTAPTCGPCRRLKPNLDKVLDEYGDAVHFVEIDIDEDPDIAEAAGVMGTPCVQFFQTKQRVAVLSGVKMKKDYREIIDQHVQAKVEAA